jgi:ABC-type transport system substrate-binding protein
MLTFYLRPEVTFHRNSSGYFHGGRRLEASDVKASFERLIKSNSPYTYIFDYVKGAADFKTGKARDVTGFEVVAPLIFRIVLTQPFPTILPWLLAPAAYILPRDMPAGYDFSKSSAGTGPFILRSWDGTVARFVANPDYWMNEGGRRLPLAKNLSIQVIKDTNTVLTAFRRGDLDLINVPLALFGEVLDVHGTPKPEWQKFVYREVKLNNLKFLAFNMQASPWGTTAGLRRRVADSIDRQAIVTQLFHGKARVAHSVVPSGLAGF